MAVIGTIRQRSGLLIFLIGLSIIGFLLMDATNSQFGALRSRKDYIGKVNGEKIPQLAFEKKLDENIKSQEEQMRGQPMTDDMRNYLRTQTWNELVSEVIFKDVYAKTGINVTADEMTDLATSEEFASPYLQQDPSFKNPQTGKFDANMVRMFLQNLDKDPQGVEPGTVRKQWMRFEGLLKKQQFTDKYNNLITKGLAIPTWMAEMSYNDQARTVDLKYVALNLTDINDADVKLTDDDIKNYINSHKVLFKQELETRKLQFVQYDIIPSSADTSRTLRELTEKAAEFAASKTAAEDSIFVRLNSETAFDEVYYTKDNLSSSVKDSLFAAPLKSLVGPYIEGKSLKIAKVTDRKMISDSVRVREIKISFNDVKTQEEGAAKFQLVDSIFKAIDSLKGDFSAFAATFSADEASKVKGGDAGWIKQNQRSKEFNNLVFYRAVKGKTYRLPSQEENAWYIFQVVEDRPSKQAVQVSYLSREIVPSAETQSNIYEAASIFSSDNQGEEKFLAAAKKKNVKAVESISKEDFTVQGIGSARSLVKWAFEASKGEVSAPITIGNQHIVALVELVRPAGLLDVAAVRADAGKISLITKEKKVELLTKKIKDSGATTIEALAAKLGKPEQTATAVSIGNPSLNGSFEPVAVAAAIGAGKGKVSAPVAGNSAVFVVQATNITEPQKITDFTMFAAQLKQQAQSKTRFAQEAHKKLAKIEDDRFDFF
jgi:peptidyl-prolyl cis-trans isomerase D